MLKLLNTDFFKKKSSSKEPPTVPQQKPINQKTKVRVILEDIISDKNINHFQFKIDDLDYTTRILEIGTNPDYILLDTPEPEIAPELIIKEDDIELLSTYDQVQISFKLEHIGLTAHQGRTLIRCELPENICYPSRRSSFRIQTDNSQPIIFQSTSPATQIPITGHIVDLSHGGLSVALPSLLANKIQLGDTLKDCQLHLLDDSNLILDLTVRSKKTSKQSDGLLEVGGQFLFTNPQDKHKLQRYITSLERQSIRNRQL